MNKKWARRRAKKRQKRCLITMTFGNQTYKVKSMDFRWTGPNKPMAKALFTGEVTFESQYLCNTHETDDACPKCETGQLKYYPTGRVRCMGSRRHGSCGFERK